MESSDQAHGFVAMRTTHDSGDFYQSRGWRGGQRIEQGAKAKMFRFCRRRKPSVSADAAQAFGEDVLKEAGDEEEGGKSCRAEFTGFGVAVAEGDDAIVFVELAFGANGGAVDVARKVGQCLLAGAGGLAVDDPVFAPDGGRDLSEESGMIQEGAAEPGPEAKAEDFDAKEERRIGRSEGRAGLRKAESRDNVVDMRMVNELATPGVEGAQEPEFGAEFGGSDILQGRGTFLKKEIKHHALVRANERAKLLGHSEGDQMIGHGKKPCGLAVDPCGGLALPALRAGAMTAAMEGEVRLTALAAVNAAAALRGVARKDRAHRRMMRGQDVGCAVFGQISGPVPAQDLRQGGCSHLAFEGKAGVEAFERLAGLLFADGGEMGVDQRRLEAGVAEVLTDEPYRDAFFQEMRRIRVPQRMNHRVLGQAGRGGALLKGDLHRSFADGVAGAPRRLLRRDLHTLPAAAKTREKEVPVTVAQPEAAQNADHGGRDRHEAFTSTLGMAKAETPGRRLDVAGCQCHGFPDAQPAMIDELKNHPEAQAARRPKNGRDLFPCEHNGQALRTPHLDRLPEAPLPTQVVAVERPQRHDGLRHRTRRVVTLIAQKEQEVANLPLFELGRIAGQVTGHGHHMHEIAFLRPWTEVLELDETNELGYR